MPWDPRYADTFLLQWSFLMSTHEQWLSNFIISLLFTLVLLVASELARHDGTVAKQCQSRYLTYPFNCDDLLGLRADELILAMWSSVSLNFTISDQFKEHLL